MPHNRGAAAVGVGTGFGAFAAALKERFPEAEVWSPAYRDTGFPALMRMAGFVNMKVAAKTGTAFMDVHGFKPA